MKTRTIKIIVDILMFLILILLIFTVGGIPVLFHFIGGLVFAGLYLTHIILNGKWFVSATRAVFKKKINMATKRLYRTDCLLLIVWSLATLSGFPTMYYSQGKIKELSVFMHIHVAFAALGCVLVAIHIYQHRKHISSYLKRMS